ncbi:MAG: type II toxin-antitoxin system PemK/MazF family toxin [Acidobacteriota bacterium]
MIKRGEIWWAALSDPRGSGPGSQRPVLVVQSDEFNRSRIRTVIAVVLTSNLRLAEAPGNLVLPKSATHLSRDSVANVSQLVTIDRSFLAEAVSLLPARWMVRVANGLQLVLGL